MIETHNYLLVGAILFVLGALGFLTRRNLILMILSAEMMLLGVSINLVAFSYLHGNNEGQSFAVFIVTVAACEAGVALALFVALFQRRHTLDSAVWRDLGEVPPAPAEREEPPAAPTEPAAPEAPHLPPAGLVPQVPKRGTVHRV
jgi:NADH-quinone oxidoreductase subunit K